MKRINVSMSDATHEKLVLLKSILKKPNFDSTIEEAINRVYEELTKK